MAPKALVTGHLGFVGKHLCDVLKANGYVVWGADLKSGEDISDCYLPPADVVFHLAAQTDAQSNQAYWDARTNITASLRLFEYYRNRVVFASSSMVNYPVCPYAISKRSGEDYARYFGCAIVRFCNLYGPGGHSVIDRFRKSERLTIYGTGQQVRTYATVSDAVVALMDAKPGQTSILPGEDYTVNEIALRFSHKPVDRVEAKPLDLMDARQIYPGVVTLGTRGQSDGYRHGQGRP